MLTNESLNTKMKSLIWKLECGYDEKIKTKNVFNVIQLEQEWCFDEENIVLDAMCTLIKIKGIKDTFLYIDKGCII